MKGKGSAWIWLPAGPECMGAGIAMDAGTPERLAGMLAEAGAAADWLKDNAGIVAAAPESVKRSLSSVQLSSPACASVDMSADEIAGNAESAGMNFDAGAPCLLSADEAETLLGIAPGDALEPGSGSEGRDGPDLVLAMEFGRNGPVFFLSPRIPACGDAEQCGWNVSEIPLEDFRNLADAAMKQTEDEDAGPRP